MSLRYVLALFLGTTISVAVQAAEAPSFALEIKDHQFNPSSLIVPVNQKFKLTVKNLDKTPEEFESYDFNREKIVPGESEITVWVGPLTPGRYEFFGEFNMDTAQGHLVAQ